MQMIQKVRDFPGFRITNLIDDQEEIMKNIIAVLFETESEGYQAITELRHFPVTEKEAILQMALVKREGNSIRMCDGFDTGIIADGGAAIGGLMGGLVGILGGPLGVLLMGSYGALTGSVAGSAASMDNSLLIGMVASKMVDGEVALIILADENDEEELNGRLSKFKVEIARFDAARVAEEVDEAEELAVENERQALEDLHRKRLEDHQAKVEAERKKLDAEYEAYIQEKQKAAEANFDRIYGGRY